MGVVPAVPPGRAQCGTGDACPSKPTVGPSKRAAEGIRRLARISTWAASAVLGTGGGEFLPFEVRTADAGRPSPNVTVFLPLAPWVKVRREVLRGIAPSW